MTFQNIMIFYRIIFEFQPEKVTIIDIVNYKRIEMLYGLLEKAKV
jgi:hypothetical protein